jgi:hypothetical protein
MMTFYKKYIPNLPTLLFFILFIVGFLEMVFYFIYIYLPMERVWGKNIGVPKDLPSLSSIINPGMLIEESPNFSDAKKNIHLDKIDFFKKEVSKLENKSEFLKSVELSYVVSGDVYDLHSFNNNNKSYSLILRNKDGTEFVEDITDQELKNIKISLITFSPKFSKTEAGMGSIYLGDYVIFKRSIEVLDDGMRSKIEIEIYAKH